MHPPKVTGTMEGTLQLEVVNDAGEGTGTPFPVDRVARLYGLDLVLVAAGDNAYLMTEADFEARQTKQTPAERHAGEVLSWVQDLVNGLTPYLPKLEPAPDAMQDAGFKLIDPRKRGVYTTRERLGYLLILNALISSPEAAQRALVAMRAALVETDPDLASMLRIAE